MALTTIELEVTSGTVSDTINAAYTLNGITTSNFKDLHIVIDNGVTKIYITYNAS